MPSRHVQFTGGGRAGWPRNADGLELISTKITRERRHAKCGVTIG